MAKVKQTKEDLMYHLEEQIQFLISSSQSFDNGFKSEAKRMATVIRVLLHDTRNSTSLLTHLRKKDMLFYDTSISHGPNNLAPKNGLIGTILRSDRADYFPLLDEIPEIQSNEKIKFEKWWNQIILESPPDYSFTRKDLVLGVCNKDGGAHIDLNLDKRYADLTRKNFLSHKFSNGKMEELITGPELAILRQIAHEVLKSFKEEFPELFNNIFNNI